MWRSRSSASSALPRPRRLDSAPRSVESWLWPSNTGGAAIAEAEEAGVARGRNERAKRLLYCARCVRRVLRLRAEAAATTAAAEGGGAACRLEGVKRVV